MYSLVALRTRNIYQFIGSGTTCIATSVKVSILGNLSEFPNVDIIGGWFLFYDNSVIINPKIAIIMFALHNFNSVSGRDNFPILMPFIPKSFLQSSIWPVCRQNYVGETKNYLISIFLFQLYYPHLIGVIFVYWA